MDLLAIEESAVGMGIALLQTMARIDDNYLPVGVAFSVAVKIQK
jgi:type III secretory pathway component EscS